MIEDAESVRMHLRPATQADAYALWLWANDAESRVASFGRGPIEWVAHVQWLSEALLSDSHLILIAELPNGPPAGVIRFDSKDVWRTARLSYTIAPEQRGHGLAGRLVADGTAQLRSRHPTASIRAEVTTENERSLRVFRAQGWSAAPAENGVITFWLRR